VQLVVAEGIVLVFGKPNQKVNGHMERTMPYRHLSFEERFSIEVLLKSGETLSGIAKILGRHVSTISREIARNSSPRRGIYAHRPAQGRSQSRSQWPRKRAKRDDPGLRLYVSGKIKAGWSPEQIAGRLRRRHPAAPGRWVSHQTVYVMVRQDLGISTSLRQARKKRRPYGSGKDRRGRLSGCTPISQRPEVVDQRQRLGDFEGDTMRGGQKRAVVGGFVERKTGLFLARKLLDRSADSMLKASKEAFSYLPQQTLLTLTLDNGKENACHRELHEDIGLDVFFADPGRPWQKGAIESIFGLLRQYIPKQADISTISQRELDRYVDDLNNRPRKRLDYRTPFEAFNELLVALDSCGVPDEMKQS